MSSSLPRSTPAVQRVDPAAILSFLDAVDKRPGIEMHSLMVVRHGLVVAEGWRAPYSAGWPQLLYSLSKSFTSTAAAFAQAEGLLNLDDTVISHFAEFAADITDPRSRSVKVRHVASMATGHTRDMLGEAIMRDLEEPVRGFLLMPPDRDPGTVFAYSQPCTYALASIIQRNAGMPLTQYLRPRLFDPLGIGHVELASAGCAGNDDLGGCPAGGVDHPDRGVRPPCRSPHVEHDGQHRPQITTHFGKDVAVPGR